MNMMRRFMRCGMLALAAAALAGGAWAGPLDEAKAKARLAAVASGNLEELMRDYADDVYMDWVGGPLDGRYRGKEALAEVWRKFAALNDGLPRTARFGKLQAQANPKGTTIEVAAEYAGKTSIKVQHVFVYRDGLLTTEIWQIAPQLQIAP